MPFKQVDIKEKISEKSAKDPEFEMTWENSRNEYALLHCKSFNEHSARNIKIRKKRA